MKSVLGSKAWQMVNSLGGVGVGVLVGAGVGEGKGEGEGEGEGTPGVGTVAVGAGAEQAVTRAVSSNTTIAKERRCMFSPLLILSPYQ